ncbi:MAG: hypothetical protein AB1635_19615 [Acidobacteriota bacterium]
MASFIAPSDPIRRVFAEYREMPGLTLTEAQASRLFGLPPAECRSVLAFLVDQGFLSKTEDDRYVCRRALERTA